MKISKNNFIFIILIIITYILLNFLLVGDMGFMQFTILQLIVIIVAISPIGEAILRIIYGAIKVKTKDDKEYLLPLFEEVYDSIRKQENYNNTKIKLYIDRSMTINAYAMGTRTIAITRGAIETLSEEQIKGMFAHEFRTYIAR